VTHNSLAAKQRPNISLIDRRHFDHAALPIRITERCTTGVYVNAKAVTRPLTALSHINVHAHRRARPGGGFGEALARASGAACC
jgi:hypothetical protein